MADFVLTAGSLFPDGTNVSVYPVYAFPPGSSQPQGPVLETRTMASGAATFTTLADGTRYWAAANIGGTWYRTDFTTNPPPVSTGTGITEIPADVLRDADVGVPSGVAPLGVDGKVPSQFLVIEGATSFKGTWNASTNIPTLVDGSGTAGDTYIVETAGTQTFNGVPVAFNVGDNVVYNGSVWQRIGDDPPVVSVAGKQGVVTLVKADVGLGNVDNTSDANKPVSTAQQTALDGKQGLNSNLTTVAGYASIANLTAITAFASANNVTLIRDGTGTWKQATVAEMRTMLGIVAGTSSSAVLNIVDPPYNATTGAADNAAAIQQALNDAGDGAVWIPKGTFNIATPLVIPSRCTVFQFGNVRVANSVSTSSPISAVWRFSAAQRGYMGMLTGGGKILCNQRANDGIFIDTWHGAKVDFLTISDAKNNSIHIRNDAPGDGGGPNGWTDTLTISHIDHISDSTCAEAVADNSLRPNRFLLAEAGDAAANGTFTDSVIRDCAIQGIKTGGWFVELVNVQRIRLEKLTMADNGGGSPTRLVAGAILIRHPTSLRDAMGHTISDCYFENQPPGATGSTAVRITQSNTATRVSQQHRIHQLDVAQTGSAAKRLELINQSGIVGLLREVNYTDPRDILFASGQITLGANTRDCRVEVQTMNEAQYVTNNGEGSNIVVPLTAPGATSDVTVTAGATLNPKACELNIVTGSTTITTIPAGAIGQILILKFGAACQVTDGSNLKLAGNFAGGVNATLALICDGTNWHEISRSTNGA